MQTARLGDTDLEVSTLGFGTAPLGGLFGPVDDTEAIRLVHEALGLGINFFDTSPYYGSGEERLGKALAGRRDEVVLATKTGRFSLDEFDFSPSRMRHSVEQSLRLLKTDYVDILQLHDIEFVPLGPVFDDSYAELVSLQSAGLCRYIGMTGYPAKTMSQAITETDLDVCLTYAHATLLDDSLQRTLAPVAESRSVGLINAAAVALGLLTPGGSKVQTTHPATTAIRRSAARMVSLCAEQGVDVAFIANQYSLQRSGCATTLIGTAKSSHLQAAAEASETMIDETLLERLLLLRPPVNERTWLSGLPENNDPTAVPST